MRDVKDIRADKNAAQTKIDQIGAQVDEIIRSARAAGRSLTDGEADKLERLERGASKANGDLERFREEELDVVRSVAERGYIERGSGPGTDEVPELTRTHLGRPAQTREERQIIDRARRIIDSAHKQLNSESGDRMNELLSRGVSEDYDPGYVARRIAITESAEYRSAFLRALAAGQTSMPALLTGPEADALRRAQELERVYERGYEVSRAMSENGANSSGLAIPAFIDPSIIVTSGAADVPILRVCRVVDVTTNLWKGVSSAGMSWSYDTEAAEVSDDTPVLAQPSATIHMARGFIPYSIEAGTDQADFYQEMAMLIDQGYNDLLAAKTMTGSGTGEPFGVFTALDASTFDEVVTTTDGSFGGEDIFKVWNALPERFRGRSTWVMSVHVQSAIRKFAAAATTGSAYFTIDLTGGEFRINDRPVIVTDYAPTFASTVPGTTGAANILAVGDWRTAYVFARRAGMSIEAVPHLFSTSNGRPTGSRGLFAWARNGATIAANNAARVLQNQ